MIKFQKKIDIYQFNTLINIRIIFIHFFHIISKSALCKNVTFNNYEMLEYI